MADHKATCKKKSDPNAACDCGADQPPVTTRKCYDCDAEIGASEKECPKCKAKLALADEEDGVVSRALTRLKKKEKEKATPTTTTTTTTTTPKKKHVFSSLSKLVNGGE